MKDSIFKSRKYSNVFVQFLEKLGVKHTRWYATKYYQEHPHKYSLWGLSNMLSAYGIENAGVRFNGYVLPEFYKVEDLVYFSDLRMK